jgi:hypothetical protein
MGIDRTYNWGDVLTLAGLNARSDKIPDNFFDGMQVLELMNKHGNVRIEETGDRIIEHLMVDHNQQAQDYAGYDVINPAPQEGLTTAEYQWSQLMVPATISGRELRSRSSKQVKDAWKAKMEQAVLSLKDLVNVEMMASDQTTAPYTVKSISGFPNMIQEDPTNSSVCGNISSAAWPHWRNYYLGAVGAYSTLLLPAMQKTWIYTSRGRKSGIPDAIIVGPVLYGFIENLVASKQYYILSNQAKDTDVGVGYLTYKGIPILCDMNLPLDSGSKYKMYWINTKYTKFQVHPDANFTPTPWVKPYNQDAIACQILLMCQLTTINRRHNSVTFGITAS